MGKSISCPICGSKLIKNFLNRSKVPVHQNLLIKHQDSATKISYGGLALAICEECSYIFNQDFDSAKLSYGNDYDNTQTYSPLFKEYLEKLVQYLVSEKSVRNCRITEVGCGNGFFLRKLIEADSSNVGYGFDPSYAGSPEEFEGRLRFEKSFYGPEYTNIQSDVVICRHVIEHVSDPLNLLLNIKESLNNSPYGRVFFETPSVEWIFSNNGFWDFFYEHVSYFSRSSLITAFETAAFQVEAIHPVFAGQYLWLEATNQVSRPGITKNPGSLPKLAQDFGLDEWELRRAWKLKIQELTKQGKVALWGAAAKGTTFANLIDPNRKLITCIIDINPHKQGKFIAGTGHPIINFKALPEYGIKTIILMNSNYRQEILALLKEINMDIDLIDLTWSGSGNYENHN